MPRRVSELWSLRFSSVVLNWHCNISSVSLELPVAEANARMSCADEIPAGALVGRKAQRDVRCHWVSFSTLLVSCALNIVATSVVSSTVGLVALRVSRLQAYEHWPVVADADWPNS